MIKNYIYNILFFISIPVAASGEYLIFDKSERWTTVIENEDSKADNCSTFVDSLGAKIIIRNYNYKEEEFMIFNPKWHFQGLNFVLLRFQFSNNKEFGLIGTAYESTIFIDRQVNEQNYNTTFTSLNESKFVEIMNFKTNENFSFSISGFEKAYANHKDCLDILSK